MPSDASPWLRGIIDTLVGAELLRCSSIPHRNRLAVILIDSAFETACRSYLQHRAKVKLTDAHKHRDNLISTVKAKLTNVDADVWNNINFYYEEIRCDFYHQSAGKTITDTALLDYRDTVEFVIDQAFGTKMHPTVEELLAEVAANKEPEVDVAAPAGSVSVCDVKDRVDKVLVAVSQAVPKSVNDLNEFFKREGESLRLKPEDFTNVVARNSGSKRLFYFDRAESTWKPSKGGLRRLRDLSGG